MHVTDDGTVVGSIDRAALEKVEPKTDEAKAELERLQAEAKAAEQPEPDEQPDEQPDESDETPEADEQPDETPRPSMALSKEELVERARGKVDEPESKTKAELVEALGGKS